MLVNVNRLAMMTVISLTGCVSSGTDWPQTAHEAERLIAQNRPAQAARLYQGLAQNSEKKSLSLEFQLLTLDALLKAGQTETAKAHADAIAADGLPPALRARLALYYAQIHLSEGDAERALTWLTSIPSEQLSGDHLADYAKALAFAQSLTGQSAQSMVTRIRFNHILDRQARHLNQLEILKTLATLEQNAEPFPALSEPWQPLLQALQTGERHALELWQQKNPGHPANDPEFFKDVLLAQQSLFIKSRVLAVMLPESGPFLPAAKAIRQGILAAQKNDPDPGKTTLKFYDTESGPAIGELYHRALADQARIIIGPLEKNHIQELVAQVKITQPVLALNTIDGVFRNKLYQFALNPADDIAAVVAQANTNNHRKALALIPDTAKGERILRLLHSALSQQGGELIAAQRYSPHRFDYQQSLNRLLGINHSQKRIEQLSKVLPEIQAKASPGSGADFIFVSANIQTAQALIPQIKTSAPELTIYTENTVNTGLPEANFENVIVCDSPWLIPGSYDGELPLQAIRQALNENHSHLHLRLVAMGIDAYHLSRALQDPTALYYPGVSGSLSLTPEQRIQRQLPCARFQDSQLVRLRANGKTHEKRAKVTSFVAQ